MEEELTIEELYTEDLDELSQEEDNVIEEPADDPQIPTEDQDSGEGGEQLPIEVATIDEVEPDEEDVLNPEEENDLTEPEVAAGEHTPQPLVPNQLTLPTIGSVGQGQRVMIALINGEPTVLGTVGSGDATNLRISTIEADYIKTAQLEAEKARISDLETNKASVTELNAANAEIANLKTSKADVTALNAATADIAELKTGKASVSALNAATADIANLKTGKADVSALNATNANVTALQTGKADIDLANVDNAWISSGTIKNAAITDTMINSVSANKLTAGTIDASNITVTNLNASNITTGTINGQRIGQGSLSLDKLAESVYTQEEIDDIAADLEGQILAQIETFTGSAVPTLSNYPASSWADAETRHKHVGDIYYVINDQLPQDGYCYRFAEGANSSFSWVLIKDSDVTKALKDLLEVQGDISDIQSFDTQVSSYMANTTDELTSVKSRATSLETRMGNAESNISTKVSTSTFNTLSQTVDANSASIVTLTETTEEMQEDIDGKASQSSVTTLSNTVNTVQQTANANSASISSLQTTVANKADSSTVTAVSNRVSSLDQDLQGFKTTVSETYAQQEDLEDLEGNVTTLSGTVSQHATAIEQNANAITAKANASDVYNKTTIDGKFSQEVTNRNAAIQASANGITSTVEQNYTLKSTTDDLDARVTENTTALEDKADSKDVYSKEQVDDSIQEVTTNYKSEIKEAADQITQSIQEDYADKDSVTSLRTLITETATSWGLDFTQIRTALNEAVDAIGLTDQNIENLTTYVHVENEGTSPCLTLGSSDSDITAALLNNRLEFRVKGSSEPVAYIEVDPNTHIGKLYITSAVVTSEMNFGYWKWYKRKNDNLTLKWIGA